MTVKSGMGFYKLDGHEAVPVPVEDAVEWARWFEMADRRVAETKTGKMTWVSTVFLGIDHRFGGDQPILFETLVFGGPLDGEMDRYATWEEAERGHKVMVGRVSEANE